MLDTLYQQERTMHPRTTATLTAVCVATLAEGAAIALFLVMLALWCGIGSSRI